MNSSQIIIILIVSFCVGCAKAPINSIPPKINQEKELDVVERLASLENYIDQGDLEWACGTGINTAEKVIRASELAAALGNGSISLETTTRFNKLKNFCVDQL